MDIEFDEDDPPFFVEERRYEEPLSLWRKFINPIRGFFGLPMYEPTLVICMREPRRATPLLLPPPEDNGL